MYCFQFGWLIYTYNADVYLAVHALFLMNMVIFNRLLDYECIVCSVLNGHPIQCPA